MMSRIRLVICMVLPAIVLAVAACAPRIDKNKAATGAWSQEKLAAATTSDGYIGNDACQPCHPASLKSITGRGI